MTCLILIYFAIAIVIFYSEAMDCYRGGMRFDLKRALIISLLWVLSIPYGVYLVWKESEQ